MKRRSVLLTLMAMAAGATLKGFDTTVDRTYIANHENVLGTSLDLRVRASSQAVADQAEHAVLAEIERLSRILSTWDQTSEVSQWSRTLGRPVRVSRDLFDVLDLYDQWRARSHGVLDPSAQAVIALWKNAATEHRLPTESEKASAIQAVQQQHWVLSREAQTATHVSTAPLVLASFTKSYIIEKAVDATRSIGGVHGILLNVGGDIIVRGPDGEQIDLANPHDDAENSTPLTTILVRDRAVATSGDYRRGIEIGGRHYSHIVDPRTAMPAATVSSATVVAENPTDAGALATAFTILSPSESSVLAASIPGVEYLLVTPEGKRIASPGWRLLEAAARQPASARPLLLQGTSGTAKTQAPARGAWDSNMELAVDFEIPMLADAAAKRPFIALWIEDADKFPVRTIALWYHEDRWLTESKAWYRADRLRSLSETMSIVRTIGAATRPPGKYTLKWDGKDNSGALVKAGAYTVFLESVREHGTYQLLRKEMKFSGAPQRFDFKPGSELGTVSFDYRKAAR